MTSKSVIAIPPAAQLLARLPIIIGLAVLYVPSLYDLFTGIWRSDEQMHRPIVLGRPQDILLFDIGSAT